jgi:hypothetical protein
MSRAEQIDEHGITHSESYRLIVLNNGGSASDLKENKVVIYTIKANVLLCPLNAVSVAAKIYCCEAI